MAKVFEKFFLMGMANNVKMCCHPLLFPWNATVYYGCILKNETDFFTTPKKVLHFAPEQAFYKRFKKIKHFDYVTTDLNSPIATVKADICNLPFESNSFDVILM